MVDDQDECTSRIEPLFRPLHDSLRDGMEFYQDPKNYSPVAIAQQRDRTAAGCVNDHAFHKLRERLDGVPGHHFLNIRGLEVLNYKDLAVIRIKKVNGAGRGRNYKTPQQKDYDDQKSCDELPPAAVRLVAGYQPDPAFSAVRRVIISKPLGKTILWAAQIVPAEDGAAWVDITPARLAGTGRTDFDAARGRT
jgi:hypothetical protein